MSTTAVLTGTQWSVDPIHSEIAFKVKHLMITNVKGVFGKYSATINADDQHPITPDVHLTIDPASISTGDAAATNTCEPEISLMLKIFTPLNLPENHWIRSTTQITSSMAT